MARKTRRLKRFQSVDFGIVVFVIFALAAVSIFIDANYTGFVINKDMVSFRERLCPYSKATVPVFAERTGGVGNKVLVKCISPNQAVEAQGTTFPVTRIEGIDIPQTPSDPHKFYPVPDR